MNSENQQFLWILITGCNSNFKKTNLTSVAFFYIPIILFQQELSLYILKLLRFQRLFVSLPQVQFAIILVIIFYLNREGKNYPSILRHKLDQIYSRTSIIRTLSFAELGALRTGNFFTLKYFYVCIDVM